MKTTSWPSGSGIPGSASPLEQQRTLFIPFKQVESDTNRRFGGTGLGLAICHQLTQKMGELTPESTPEWALVRTFTLPRPSASGKRRLTGQVWWWFGEDEGLESVMARLGARLVRHGGTPLAAAPRGASAGAGESPGAGPGSDWLACLQRSNLKGIVLSP